MEQRFAGARGTGNVDAAVSSFIFGVMHVHAADWAFVGHLKFSFFGSVLHDFQHVRNYFAGAFDQNRVAGVDVEAANLVEIVQSGFHDGDAADLHRLENGKWSQDAGAAHADHDFAEQRGFLMRLIFGGDGPARRFRGVAEFVLQADFVDFDDDAVDLEAELFALRVPLGDVFLHFTDAVAQFPIFADFKTHGAERFERSEERRVGKE